MASQSEAGWGGTQRPVDKRQHALQIAIDFIVPEAQYSETFARQATVRLRIAPDMRIEIVLTAIDLDASTLPPRLRASS